MNGTEGTPVVDTAGKVHATVGYPFANTVGCSCGWVRRGVDPMIHDALIEQHLNHVTGREVQR